MLLLALLLAVVALSVALWFADLCADRAQAQRELLQEQLDEANGAIRDLLQQNARIAALYVDLGGRFVTAMAREAATDDGDDPDDGHVVAPPRRLVS